LSTTADATTEQLGKLAGQFELIFDTEPSLARLTGTARGVLAMAAALYYQHGYAATSVRDLTRACGLTPGALYNHFPSRDEVLFALVEGGHLRAQRALDEALAKTSGPRDALTKFVRAYTEIHLRFPPFAQLIHREYVHLSEARKREIVQRRRRMREQLVDILRAGSAQGVFTLIEGPHAEVASAMMVLDMCSRTSEWFNPKQPADGFSERYAAAVLRLVGARLR
jgi:AcrR family transcriptional regulator